MVMADRDDVTTTSVPIAGITMLGLAQNLTNGLLRVPFRNPAHGPSGPLQNVGATVTRQVLRSFMGYSTALPIEEFRSMELFLDRLCKVVLPPWVRLRNGVDREPGTVAEVPGIWLRPHGIEPRATILYLHGGGYIGTSPEMYAAWVGSLAQGTRCEVFVVDYRLAPEFPYPAGLEDALEVHEALRRRADGGVLIVAGDSGGGGLATSLVEALADADRPGPDGLVLLSPEVDLDLDDPSVTENASADILPWNIPVSPYLRGVDPADGRVSAVHAEVETYPPTFVASGGREMFRDAIRRLVDRMEAAGLDVEALEEPGMFHVFPILMPWASASRRVVAAIDDFVDRQVVLAAERLRVDG